MAASVAMTSVAPQRHQRVTGQREQLQPHVDDQEVVAADHDEDAQQAEQGEREQLAATQHVALARIRLAVDQRDHHRQRGKTLEPVAHLVADDQFAETILVQAAECVFGLMPATTASVASVRTVGQVVALHS
jgi:hypothetical protein